MSFILSAYFDVIKTGSKHRATKEKNKTNNFIQMLSFLKLLGKKYFRKESRVKE